MTVFSRLLRMAQHESPATDTESDDHPRLSRGWVVGLGLAAIVIGFGCWLTVRAFDVKSSLEAAQHSSHQAKDALLQGDAAEALRLADAAQAHATDAQEDTHSVPWNVAAAIPWLGTPFASGQQMTGVVLGLTTDVLRPAADAGIAISPKQVFDGGRLDVALLRKEEPALQDISGAAARLESDADAIADPGFPSALRDAHSELQRQTSDLASTLTNIALAARLAPPLLGADGPRTYFMGFQTNAEARGTGGLLGGFGIWHFDQGVPTVDTLAPNTELDKRFVPLDLGPEYTDQYGFANATTDYRNSNLSPHFPYTAQIWKSMWAQQTGMNVDGVVAIDPVALSYVLHAVGPVTMPDGELITGDNVVELTESTAYLRFPTDQRARKAYLQDIAREVVEKITGPVRSPRDLLEALGKAVSERRIALWSASPDDQKLIETTPLGHAVPGDPAPYAQVIVNNLGGNKLDYYLQRGIEYAADGCGGQTRNSTVTVQLTNTAPPDLPEFVAGSGGVVEGAPVTFLNGTMVTSVRLIATKGAELTSAISGGQRLPVFRSTELGHPTFEIQVAIPPGKSGELSFHLSEPTSPGQARVPIQPLVDTVSPVVSVPECAG